MGRGINDIESIIGDGLIVSFVILVVSLFVGADAVVAVLIECNPWVMSR